MCSVLRGCALLVMFCPQRGAKLEFWKFTVSEKSCTVYLLKGSYDVAKKNIILGIWCNVICVYAV